MSRTTQFIELYKKLEEVVKDTYRLNDEDSISFYLTKHTKYKRNRNEIKYCQQVRNLLSHNRKIHDNFAVEPSKEMITFIENLIEDILNRTQSKDIAVKYGDIFSKSMNDVVNEAMITMRKNNYTHVPILEEGIVRGVFDENSIFNYLADNEIITFDGATFADLEEYLNLDNREYVQFAFVSPSDYVEDLYKLFRQKLSEGIRLGMIFVTPSGKQTEKITGIITPWDILGKE